jgi:hypothetical protein
MNDEFLCMTLHSNPGETLAQFKTRLTEFWTYMIRTKPDEYEQVYAESRDFEQVAGKIQRSYMIEIAVLPVLQAACAELGMGHLPVDVDDTYNRHEASTSEWFQIPHD